MMICEMVKQTKDVHEIIQSTQNVKQSNKIQPIEKGSIKNHDEVLQTNADYLILFVLRTRTMTDYPCN